MTSYDDIKHLFPVKIEKGKDFEKGLQECLGNYCAILKEHNEPDETVEFCKAVNKQILAVIKNMRKGAHSTAYKQLENILKVDNKKYGIDVNDLLKEEEGYYYRMRKVDNRRGINSNEMFHITFNLRSQVSTERYSFPGLPCLYLGSSIYVCWEEMGRPEFSHVMVSALKTTRKLKLLDLRAPVHRRWHQTNKKVLPLILACQVMVADKDAKYKSEYIIPQLIMEYVITNYDNIDGVLYTSVFKDPLFYYPVDKFYNIALPAIQIDSKEKYSKKLRESFTITSPTCEEYERLNRHIGVKDISTTIEVTSVPQNKNYEISIFKEIETIIKDEDLFPMHEIKESI